MAKVLKEYVWIDHKNIKSKHWSNIFKFYELLVAVSYLLIYVHALSIVHYFLRQFVKQ